MAITTVLTFGKYKGSELDAIPTEYLEWGVDKLESPKWRKEFDTELKRRRNENEKRKSFIKQNINTDEVWHMLVKEAEKELEPSDGDDYRIVKQSDIDQLAKEKLQKYQAEIELEKVEKDFMEKWGVTKTQIDKIQEAFWMDSLSFPSMFSTQEKYEAACELATKRDELIKKMFDC